MKSLHDILNWLPVERRAKIEARTEALRQALIEGEESGPDSPLDLEEIRRKAPEEAVEVCALRQNSAVGPHPVDQEVSFQAGAENRASFRGRGANKARGHKARGQVSYWHISLMNELK